MTSRKQIWVRAATATAAAASLALGSALFAQESDRPSGGSAGGASDPASAAPSGQSGGQTGGASGQAGQAGQTTQPSGAAAGQAGAGQAGEPTQAQRDAQAKIDQLLAQIAADPKTSADKMFVLTAALHTQSELEMARAVAEKSQNPQVKQMAQQLMQNLQQTQQQLMQTAKAIGLELPQELAQAAVQEVRIVAALPADQLDKQFTAQAQSNAARDLSQYQAQAQIAQDPQVRQFAQQQVAGIQKRSMNVNQTAQGMGMPGGMGGAGEAQPAGAKMPPGGSSGSSDTGGTTGGTTGGGTGSESR